MAQTNWQKFLDTWGTVPIGNARFTIRTLVLIACIVIIMLDVAVQTSTRAIIALSLNMAFVLAAILASKATRTVSLRVLAYCFLSGVAMMAVAYAIGSGVMLLLGINSPLRPYVIAPIEDLCRIVPVILCLWQGRKFSTWTMGASDVALLGAASGAGFAFIEDAFANTPLGSSSPFFWVPATVMYNGHLIAGHAVWSTFAACTIGLGLLAVRNKQLSLGLLLAGFSWAMLDHVAMDASIQRQDFISGVLIFFAANGYFTLLLFVISFFSVIAFDLWLILKIPPEYPEFRLLSKEQRADAIATVWQLILDRRRFAYALFRHRSAPGDTVYSFATAIVGQSLINYHRGAQVKQIVKQAQPKKAASRPAVASKGPTASTVPASFAGRFTAESDTEQALAAPDFARKPYADAMDAIVGGRRSFNTQEDSTLNLGDLNTTHTPTPGGGPSEMMLELKLPGQYILLSQLSAGGMGMIYRAKHRHTGANLAIKVLHPHVAKLAVNVMRFEQEAKAACALNHPNLVVVHDFGVTPEAVPYLVMDLIEGVSLQAMIKGKGTLSYHRFINIFIQVCNALSHAHSRGVIHRDIKPSNILISPSEHGDEFVRIVDFGIAKIVHKDGTATDELTRTGDLVGSPLYMSPEQCLGNTLDARSDIYSMGCVMYFTLTGQEPFMGKNAVQTIFKHLHEMPTRPSELRPNVPPEIEQIIFRAVQKNPDNRYSCADDVAAALEYVKQMGIGNLH